MHDFERVGGNVALDFLNTINDWTAEEPADYLADPAAAVRFGEQSGVLSRAEAKRVANHLSTLELGRLKALRTLLERSLQALLDERSPTTEDLGALDQLRTDVARASAFVRSGGRLTSIVSVDRAAGATLRLRLAAAALDLVAAPDLARLKRCPACAWFFLDVSRNGSRRWCSMATCGTTAKAHRYYWKGRTPSP